MRHAEALISSIIKWLQETGSAPTEMVLPERAFLNLAADLRICHPSARIWAVSDPTNIMSFANADPMAKNDPWRDVQVEDSFVFNGPGGPITIRRAKSPTSSTNGG